MRKWLLQIRNTKGLTQKDVAQLAGISRSYYADIERGDRDPGGRAAKRLADELGFDMALFYDQNGRETSHANKPA